MYRVLKIYLADGVTDDDALDMVDGLCNHKKKWQFWKKDTPCRFYSATILSERLDD